MELTFSIVEWYSTVVAAAAVDKTRMVDFDHQSTLNHVKFR